MSKSVENMSLKSSLRQVYGFHLLESDGDSEGWLLGDELGWLLGAVLKLGAIEGKDETLG